MAHANLSPLIKAQVKKKNLLLTFVFCSLKLLILISQIEKLTTAGGGITPGRRPISSSSPIIIPKKPPRSNVSIK